MDNSKIHLALDFDGVIADSINECLVVSYNAFGKFIGKNSRIFSIDKIEENRVIESRRLRNFIRSGEDYVYIQLALQENALIRNQQEFDDFCGKYAELREQFFNMFYNEREQFSTDNFQNWIKLNPLYEGFELFLKYYQFKKQLYIISTKKIEFIQRILEAGEIDLINENMFHASSNRPKKMIIKELLESRGVGPEKFYFIDDQIDTLIKVKETEVNCLFAKWGYNNPEQLGKAEREGIQAIDLQEFLQRFSSS